MADEIVKRRKPSPQRLARYREERDAIVRAAYHLIGTSPNTSVADILKAANLSTRAFYRHFPSKDDLILFMYRSDSERVSARLSDAVTRAATPIEALEGWVREYLSVAYDPRRARKARVLSSTEAVSAMGFAEVQAEEAQGQQQIVRRVFEQGRADGSLPRTEPAEDAYALHALVTHYVTARLFGGHNVSFETAQRHTVNLFVRGLS